MKKTEKALKLLAAALAVFLVMGCDLLNGNDDKDTKGNQTGTGTNTDPDVQEGVSFKDEPNGTLTVLNNTSKDMVIFQGQTPQASSILGGVKALSQRTLDISDDVSDFSVGGYMILRGMTLDEYTKNKTNLSLGKVEYSAMATYGQNKKYRAEISSAYTGDYYFKVTNGGRIGIELRKDSPDGEKIGYLPALATNYLVYAAAPNSITVYPVYVYYSNLTREVTTIKPASWADSASIGPRPVNDNSVSTIRFPTSDLSWAEIIANITYPVAFVSVTNSVPNQDARFQSASKQYFAQNGYDSVNSGDTEIFEVKASDDGQELLLNLVIYGGNLPIAVKDADGNNPTIKNGYEYAVTLKMLGADYTKADNYSATIVEGKKRNVEKELSSL
jgi:hypothetical protein